MTRNELFAATLGVVLLAIPAASLRAEDSLPVLTRKVFNDYKDCIVGVSGVAKMSFSAMDSKAPLNLPDQERKFEATGTIIDPSGLVVVSLSTIDPAKEISGREFNTQQGRVKIDATAILKEVKIVMPDGVEVPSDVVMKDVDLDLAFVRPKADSKESKAATYKAIDLKKGANAEIADDTVTVWRMEDVMNRKPGVMGGQVMALTQKPRTFVRVANAMLGCPTFEMDGKLIGIGVFRSAKDKAPVVVVLPAADVFEIAEQAKAAKPVADPEPKAADTQNSEKDGEKK